MNMLDFLKKTCSDGTQIWVWESCVPPAPAPDPLPEPPTGPDSPTPEPEPGPADPATPTPAPVAFNGFNIGPEELCGSFAGSRPSISTTSTGLPFIVIDKGSSNVLYLYGKVNGTWKEREFARGSKGGEYDASRLYLPHIEIDNADRIWVSCKFGCKEYGRMLGQGLWLLNGQTLLPSKFSWITASETHKGNGNVVTDPGRVGMARVVATTGRWVQVNTNMDRVGRGTTNIGMSGEKIRTLISPTSNRLPGVMHTVMGGYNAQSSSYVTDKMSKWLVWANCGSYPIMGSDFEHPGIGIDVTNPDVCYISATYKGIVINVWTGTKFAYSPASLKVIDPDGSMGTDRFGPQWAPHISGGSFLVWVNAKRIKMVKVTKYGKVGQIMDICAGNNPSICMGRDGTIHLAYVNGGMRYRKLTLKSA